MGSASDVDLEAFTGERENPLVRLWAALHSHHLGVGGRGGGKG